MRDGRSKTATDNKSYDDTFYRSIGERSFLSVLPEKQIPRRKLELSRERSPLPLRESSASSSRAGNLSLLERTIQHPSLACLLCHLRPPGPSNTSTPRFWTNHLLYPCPFVPLPRLLDTDRSLSVVNFISPWKFPPDRSPRTRYDQSRFTDIQKTMTRI